MNCRYCGETPDWRSWCGLILGTCWECRRQVVVAFERHLLHNKDVDRQLLLKAYGLLAELLHDTDNLPASEARDEAH